MKYLVVQEWNSTKGNHAGMRHMCDLLIAKYPETYSLIVNTGAPDVRPTKSRIWRRIQTTWMRWRIKWYEPVKYRWVCRKMYHKLHRGDEVFLLEYCCLQVPQIGIAQYVKEHFPDVPVYGLCHLTPTYKFSSGMTYPLVLQQWIPWCDKVLTLGTSLSRFIESCGVSKEKISTGFHYVDNAYYYKEVISVHNRRLRVIAMGMMQRNYNLISDIVRNTPMVDWIICKGNKPIDNMFSGIQNVTLKGYIREAELRTEMDGADVSLNIMEDTVGSNVVTTSLAMGLAMICSDVGSIRDYCGEDNCIFCQNIMEDFVAAIVRLDADRERLYSMRRASLEKSRELTIENVHLWFSQL